MSAPPETDHFRLRSGSSDQRRKPAPALLVDCAHNDRRRDQLTHAERVAPWTLAKISAATRSASTVPASSTRSARSEQRSVGNTGSRHYGEPMDYLACPDDGEHLEVAQGTREPGRPLQVMCPSCGRRFTFDSTGLVELAAEGS